MLHITAIESFEEFEARAEGLMHPAFRSKFGAISWRDTFAPAKQHYEWLIKGIIPTREAVLIYGAPQTGKSFETQNIAMHIARGVDFQGRRTKKAGVVYCAFEGGKGFKGRQLAYASHHQMNPEDDVDMVVLTRRADLFADDTDITDLIAEIRHWGGTFSSELGLVVLDTWSAATPGADENAGKDVSRVKERVMRIVNELNTAVIVVHHKPASGGRPRGHGSLTGDFETTIDIDWVTESGTRQDAPRGPHNSVKDEDKRPIRAATVTKQREGEQGLSWRFVLKRIEIGQDADGDPISSCVSLLPAGLSAEAKDAPTSGGPAKTADGRFILKPNLATAFRALSNALGEKGREPPPSVRVPARTKVVTLAEWRDEYERIVAGEDEDPEALKERVKKARDRAAERLLLSGFIGKDGDWVWRTGKPVMGVDPPKLPEKTEAQNEALDQFDTGEFKW
ncbi:AAA family ATPase [Bosea sp. TAF32]|uniref:AAA family ATPase n=1 Tax=Bosea sp. TAF32 TaxID=3237482 RepID=UPI003F902165